MLEREVHKRGGYRPPATPLEALMQADAHQEPALSQQELQPLLDVVRDAMESALTSQETWIVEAHWWRRMSYREIAAELGVGKSQVHRIAQTALRKMADALEGERDNLLAALGAQEPSL